jgi:hypothetical protein
MCCEEADCSQHFFFFFLFLFLNNGLGQDQLERS